MAGEKKRVSEEIVKVIESRTDALIAQVDHGQSEKLERAIDSYRESVEAHYQLKLRKLIEKNKQHENRELSALEFDIGSKLKIYRNELLEDFKKSIEQDLLEIKKDKVKYKEYLMSHLNQCEPGGIVRISEEDAALIKGFTVEFNNLPLGGFFYEIDNRIYDYSFETRYLEGINDFINESQLWIRSDEN